ncbi:MAG: pilus assembly protein PilM [Patescibacteria group bacterium]
MIIYGGGGLLKGLVEKAAERFGLETSLGQPFNRLEFPSLVQPAVKEVGPSFATAIGLALRGLK